MSLPGDMDPYAICAAPRILFIDAYDSFANNIVALLQQALNAHVTSIHIDHPHFTPASPADFYRYLDAFDAVVAGPGPGTVANPQDTGLISSLWTLPDDHLLPVLGICLGFQSLAHAFGATVERLSEPRHGIITRVHHRGHSLFENLREVHATQYHSLHVKPAPSSPPSDLWSPSAQCPSLKPLAWDRDSAQNGPVLMSVEHMSKPFWGVQYHPESICTDSEGAGIVQNWWAQASRWLLSRPSRRHRRGSSKLVKSSATGQGFQNGIPSPKDTCWDGLHYRLLQASLVNRPGVRVEYQCIPSTEGDVRAICELLEIPGREAAVLESGLNKKKQPIRGETGSKSIIGCLETERNLRVEYFVEGQTLELRVGQDLLHREEGANVWSYLKHLMESINVTQGPVDSPFWGGLIGFVSYEAGLETINVKPTPDSGARKFRKPDLAFVFVTRSIVVDHIAQKIYIQSIRDEDSSWVQSTSRKLRTLASYSPQNPSSNLSSILKESVVSIPLSASYENKVRACQESIRAGDSYELCLTSQTTIHLPRTSSNTFSWNLYTRLRHLNPAPFGGYIRLGPPGSGVDILSSSPERFLSWTRRGRCQYRPIKGTVQKKDGQVTLAEATRILNSSKERAENLMIVDLVRHDLHGVVGAGNVRVSKLMGVEEYETVFQLVSVIEGDLTGRWAAQEREQEEELLLQQQQQPPVVPRTVLPTTAGWNPEDSSEDSDLPASTAASSQTSSLAPSPCPSPCPGVSASHPLLHHHHHHHHHHYSSSTQTSISHKKAATAAVAPPQNRAIDDDDDDDDDANDQASSPTTTTATATTTAANPTASTSAPATGIAILHASLPPGSMTGAPKKRSCELLDGIEERQPRGVYSGVLGYLDVGGGGDFAVVIRTAWRWDGEEGGEEEEKEEEEEEDGRGEKGSGTEIWRVGAGGAVTAQSTPEGEYAEMVVKLESALRVFDAGVEVDV
ncbi:aminodeoxychorismate synthase [Diplodia corticola]|uniref:aminodeoxychorismate synthase n=1 Tax=Diplodia corticola TaxID=236234 RepID=A0A1J9QU02_9PEZI|nr:aminodeoxychorismate synthase [Diplodia corticola]OJD31928.1 aminodeoxychorismate synthase [Diplodia corticola]